MSLKAVHEKRAKKIEEVPVPGIGTVRIKRLSADEIAELPEDKTGATQVQATVLKDEEDVPFYADVAAAGADGVICNALLKASNSVNKLDLDAAEAK